jgi:zona occludens toxin
MAGVTSIVGLQGSGKSYSSVELALIPSLVNGRTIVTNLPLLKEMIESDFPNSKIIDIDLNDKTCLDYPVKGAVYILDELWKIWKNGDKMRDIPQNHLVFLKEHRHMSDDTGRSIDIFLLTQTLEDFPAAIRNTIEKTIICEKILDLGMSDRFKRSYYSGAVKGFKGSDRQLIKIEPAMKYSSDVFRYYKTHMYSENNDFVNEDRVVTASLFSSVQFRFYVAVFIMLLSIVFYSFYSLFGKDNKKQSFQPNSIQQQGQLKPIQNIKTQQVNNHESDKIKPYSTVWRLLIDLDSNFKHIVWSSYFTLRNSRGDERRISSKHCWRDDGLETFCLIDNTLVTRWTAPPQDDRKPLSLAVRDKVNEVIK